VPPLPAFAFVDLETTGTHAEADRITEIGIVRVDDVGGEARVSEWQSLVDPGVPIPPAIQVLTGITDAMVAAAPSFASVARDVLERIRDCVFVAHNARFDYGFLKHAFARLDVAFTARVLCAVRLSRRLYPDAEGHGLDALIARHGLSGADRHRALGDARAIWSFVEMLYRNEPRERVDAAMRHILRVPSLPPQLPQDAIDSLPEAPGVYLFYGDNPLPLYIGKSVNLRERVAAHFTGDWRSETDLRLSREIRRIEHEETAGELGALLREAVLVKSLLPAHNRALRRKQEAGVGLLVDGMPAFVPSDVVDFRDLGDAFGPFASRASFRATLRELAREHALCERRMRLERGHDGPCFARQLQRSRGACVGAESPADHDARMHAALAPLAIPRWPVAGIGCVRECTPHRARAAVHVFRDWSWLGSARDDGELQALVEAPPRPSFDLDVTRLLIRRHRAGQLPLVTWGSEL
jgi:DNA polymerase-3 subunit epsilon